MLMNVLSRKSNFGRKRKGCSGKLESLENVPLKQRSLQKLTAAALGIQKFTVHVLVKEKRIQAHLNPVKLFLSTLDMQRRVEFLIKHIKMKRGTFHPTLSIVHSEKKWFLMMKNNRQCYLVHTETKQLWTTKSKCISAKVVYLAAVARSRCDTAGKIGIWPFTKVETARRTSLSRAAGISLTRPSGLVTIVMYRQFPLKNPVLAVQKNGVNVTKKWPSESNKIMQERISRSPILQFWRRF